MNETTTKIVSIYFNDGGELECLGVDLFFILKLC